MVSPPPIPGDTFNDPDIETMEGEEEPTDSELEYLGSEEDHDDINDDDDESDNDDDAAADDNDDDQSEIEGPTCGTLVCMLLFGL